MVNRRNIEEKVFVVSVILLSIIAVAPVFHVLATVIYNGMLAIWKNGLSILTSVQNGILASIIGTAVLAILSAIIGLPLAIAAGLFVAEFPESRISKYTRLVSRSLLEIPTVLTSMLVYTIVVVPMGSFSLLAGALALSIVMLPYVMVSVEQAIESVPPMYREAGYSIGMTRAQVLLGVVAGVARRGIATGILVGLAKAMGETAPLLFTIGAARSYLPCSRVPALANILSPGDAIPLMIYQYAQTPQESLHEMAWAGSLILVIAYLLVFAGIRRLVREVRI